MQCLQAAEAVAQTYQARSKQLRKEVQDTRRQWQRARSEIQGRAAAAAGMGMEQRRALGSELAGLAGAGAAAVARSGGGVAFSVTETDASCKAQRMQSNLEWRGVDWRFENKYNPHRHGRSLDMAAAILGGGRGGGVGVLGVQWEGEGGVVGPLPVVRSQDVHSSVRIMKATRRVVEGLARDKFERR